jgi:SAM-dependent methyltransferase
MMSQGFEYVGVDVSKEFIRIAQKNNPEASFHHADFASVRLPRNFASIAWFSSSLQHVGRDALLKVLTKAWDVLVPGGLLFAHYRTGAGEGIATTHEYCGFPVERYLVHYTPREMEIALKKACFAPMTEILPFMLEAAQDTNHVMLKGASLTYFAGYRAERSSVVRYKSITCARKFGRVPGVG